MILLNSKEWLSLVLKGVGRAGSSVMGERRESE